MSGRKDPAMRGRILEAARLLFNAEGYAGLSALDIATALGISPGHLYYHFKGKSEIARALAESYLDEAGLVLAAAEEAVAGPGATIEMVWTHLHIWVEEAFDMRFLYREAGPIARRNPAIAAILRQLITRQTETLTRLLARLDGAGAISVGPTARDGLARQIVLGVGLAETQLELMGDPGPDRARLARAAASLAHLIAVHAPVAKARAASRRKRAR